MGGGLRQDQMIKPSLLIISRDDSHFISWIVDDWSCKIEHDLGSRTPQTKGRWACGISGENRKFQARDMSRGEDELTRASVEGSKLDADVE